MSYVMTMKKGDDFYVDNERFLLAKVDGPQAFTIVRTRDEVTTDLVDGNSYSIAPGVHASVGTRGTTIAARIALDAPKSIMIDPGSVYREAGGHPKR